MKKIKFRYDDLRKLLIVLGVLILLLSLLFYLHSHDEMVQAILHSALSVEDLTKQLRTRTPLNFLILLLLTSSMSAVPFMSNAVFAVLNGVVYGPVIGFLMNLSSNVFGNFIFINLVSKIDFSDRESKLKGRLEELERFKNKDLGIILGYMLPIFPTVILNYAIAEMDTLSWRRWLVCASIGVLPTSLIYALGGDAIIDGNVKRLALLVSIIVLAAIVVVLIKKKRKTT